MSIITQYDKALNMYRRYYQYEQIKGADRVLIEKVPEKAFREAVANALVYRTWDINANIRISMFEDRIEISSPAGLPNKKPRFDIKDNSITVTLPVLSATMSVTSDENKLLELLKGEMRYSSSEIAEKLNWSKDKAVRTLNALVDVGYVVKYGTGRGTRYSKQ